MSKSKSPLARGLRALYLLPLICLALSLQARTVYEPVVKVNEKGSNAVQDTTAIKIAGNAVISDGEAFTNNDSPKIRVVSTKEGAASPMFILRQATGKETEITQEEMSKLDPGRISSMEVLKDASSIEKYGEKASNGVVIITLKKQQELDGIVVIGYDEESDEMVPFYLLEPDTMPEFREGDMNSFSKWVYERIRYPKGCTHTGTMEVGFVVDTEGNVKDVQIIENVCEELDAMVITIVSQSPKWDKPATSNGKPVAQHLTIPIEFRRRQAR
jgi:TonB family protein